VVQTCARVGRGQDREERIVDVVYEFSVHRENAARLIHMDEEHRAVDGDLPVVLLKADVKTVVGPVGGSLVAKRLRKLAGSTPNAGPPMQEGPCTHFRGRIRWRFEDINKVGKASQPRDAPNRVSANENAGRVVTARVRSRNRTSNLRPQVRRSVA